MKSTFSITRGSLAIALFILLINPDHLCLGANNQSSSRIKVINQGSKRLELVFSMNQVDFENLALDDQVNLNFSTYIAIPENAQAHLEIIDSHITKMDGRIVPIDLPNEVVELSIPFQIRGIDVVTLRISPVIFDKKTKTTEFVRKLNLRISFTGNTSHFGIDRLRSIWWEPLLANMIMNYASLPKVNPINPSSKETGAEYLIICPDSPEYEQWADSIRIFRNQQGILTKVVTLDEIGGNSTSQIEAYIDEAYNTWDIPPVAVLLLGDEGNNPEYNVPAPVWENYCVSDNIYADVNGDDLPDMYAARMCAENGDQLENMVMKVINYEKTPPAELSFYDHPITACNFQTGGLSQVLTESIAGYYEVIQNKDPNRINAAPSPLPTVWTTSTIGLQLVTYFQNIGYLPDDPASVNTTWDGTTQDFINGINSGSFMMVYSGQSSETGFGNPSFSIPDLNALNNNYPTLVWSFGSLTGKFNYSSGCFAEAIHRQEHGALGVVAASEVLYSQVSEIYAIGAIDQLWDDYLPEVSTPTTTQGVFPALANVAGKYYLEQAPWPLNPGTKAATYHLFHYFGDAFSTLYTEMPQEPVVDHDPYIIEGETIFEVSANEGALIALSVDGEIIGLANGTGSVVSVPIVPQAAPGQVLITVTQRNFLRYSALIPVTIGEGVVHLLNDDFKIYPNPTHNRVTMQMERSLPDAIITFTDLVGREIIKVSANTFARNKVLIDLKGIETGIYMVKLETSSGSLLKKLVIY